MNYFLLLMVYINYFSFLTAARDSSQRWVSPPHLQVSLSPPPLFSIPFSPSLSSPQCVLALGDSDTATCDAIASTLCYCSWNNATLSAITIENLQQRIAAVSSYYEISNHFKVLTEILVISGPYTEGEKGATPPPHVILTSNFDTNPMVVSRNSRCRGDILCFVFSNGALCSDGNYMARVMLM